MASPSGSLAFFSSETCLIFDNVPMPTFLTVPKFMLQVNSDDGSRISQNDWAPDPEGHQDFLVIKKIYTRHCTPTPLHYQDPPMNKFLGVMVAVFN